VFSFVSRPKQIGHVPGYAQYFSAPVSTEQCTCTPYVRWVNYNLLVAITTKRVSTMRLGDRNGIWHARSTATTLLVIHHDSTVHWQHSTATQEHCHCLSAFSPTAGHGSHTAITVFLK